MKLGVIFVSGVLGPMALALSTTGQLEPAPSPLVAALELKYASGRSPDYQWTDSQAREGLGGGAAVALEWLPLGRTWGKWTVGVEGAATSLVQNNRRLNRIPIHLSLGYRFDYVEDQLLVPFVRGGPQFNYFHENPGRTGRYWSWAWTAGLSLCLNGIEPASAALLDSQYGVNGTYLVMEYSRSTPWQAANNLPGGDSFRAGLRFEL